MNLGKNFEQWSVSQTVLSQILRLSTGRIAQLIDEQIVIRDPSENFAVFLVESMQNYYLSKKSYGEGKKKVDFWEERGLHERAKRKLAELKLSKARGELYDANIVESTICESLTNFRNKLLGVPNKLAPQLVGKTAGQINKILTEEIEDILNELAGELEGADFNEEATDAEEADGALTENAFTNDGNAVGE